VILKTQYPRGLRPHIQPKPQSSTHRAPFQILTEINADQKQSKSPSKLLSIVFLMKLIIIQAPSSATAKSALWDIFSLHAWTISLHRPARRLKRP
jgi:hypothetical protein